MNGNVIEIAGLEKRFHKSGFQLSLPSLCVREGYITGFVGENGAGKTTTIKLLMDMLSREGGLKQAAEAAMKGDTSELQSMLDRLMKNPEGASAVERLSRSAPK